MAASSPVLVVTSWAEKDTDTLGRQFVESFHQHWSGTPLAVVTDKVVETETGYAEFIREFGHLPIHDGDMTHGAAKWARKVFALDHVLAKKHRPNWLVWIDADVKFTAPPTNLMTDVLAKGADVAFLGRPWAYASETGFVGYRMGRGTAIIEAMAERYVSGKVFSQDNWGDGYTFDISRGLFPDLIENDLAAGLKGPDLHVWPHTALGEWSEHYKGNRKKALR